MDIEGKDLNTIKAIGGKPTANNIILSGEKRKAFPLRSETRQGGPFSPLSLNRALEFPSRAMRQEKEKASESGTKR